MLVHPCPAAVTPPLPGALPPVPVPPPRSNDKPVCLSLVKFMAHLINQVRSLGGGQGVACGGVIMMITRLTGLACDAASPGRPKIVDWQCVAVKVFY